MPAGLLGSLCKGCAEDRDGVWNWEDACHEGAGGQYVRKSFLVLVYARRVLPPAESLSVQDCCRICGFKTFSTFLTWRSSIFPFFQSCIPMIMRMKKT